MSTSDTVAGAAIDARGNPQAWNMRLVGHCPMEGRGDGMHINLKDGYAFFAHMGDFGLGTSIVDVRDPSAPRLVNQLTVPERHPLPQGPDRRRHPAGQLRAVPGHRRRRAASRCSTSPGRPSRERSPSCRCPGKGIHRMTWFEGPYVYVTGSEAGWTDQFLIIVDLSDPSSPREVGRFWMPGQHAAGGEQSNAAAGPDLQAASRAGARRPRLLRLVGRGPGDPGHRRQVPAEAGEPPRLRRRRQRRDALGAAAAGPRRAGGHGRVRPQRLRGDPEAGPRGRHRGRHEPEGGQPVPGAIGGRLLLRGAAGSARTTSTRCARARSATRTSST